MTSQTTSLAQHVYRVMNEEFITPNSKAIFNGQISEEGILRGLAHELRQGGLDAGLVRITCSNAPIHMRNYPPTGGWDANYFFLVRPHVRIGQALLGLYVERQHRLSWSISPDEQRARDRMVEGKIDPGAHYYHEIEDRTDKLDPAWSVELPRRVIDLILSHATAGDLDGNTPQANAPVKRRGL